MAFPTFCRQNLAIPRELVRGWDLWLLEVHILESNGQGVFPLGPRSIIAVEIRLGANVCEPIVYEARFAIVWEEAVEGLDVGADSHLQRRVCGVVFGRVSKEIFSAKGIIFVIPLGFGGGRCHYGWSAASRRLAVVKQSAFRRHQIIPNFQPGFEASLGNCAAFSKLWLADWIVSDEEVNRTLRSTGLEVKKKKVAGADKIRSHEATVH